MQPANLATHLSCSSFALKSAIDCVKSFHHQRFSSRPIATEMTAADLRPSLFRKPEQIARDKGVRAVAKDSLEPLLSSNITILPAPFLGAIDTMKFPRTP